MSKGSIISTLAAVFFGVVLVFSLATEHKRAEGMLIGITAECKDGMFTATPRARGVCSGHGGVKRWIEKED